MVEQMNATLDQKMELKRLTGIPNLPTDLTYEARLAISGDGEYAYEWSDKPHRLVWRLCQRLEELEAQERAQPQPPSSPAI